MKLNIEPGRYVIAVSGGVDSVVLLDLLSTNPKLELIVAHYDHGMRKDSELDKNFVEKLASNYGLGFYSSIGKLGPKASEALARDKRYAFLNTIKDQTNSRAIITAHHQDDLIETVIINLLRGTNRRGLSSMYSLSIVRPLLDLPKKDLVQYALEHNLTWREDSTNSDPKYLRNYVRSEILPKLFPPERTKLINLIQGSKTSNQTIDKLLDNLLSANSNKGELSKEWFNTLPHNVAKEVMTSWLKKQQVSVDRTGIEKLVVGAKILTSGKKIDVDKKHLLSIKNNYLALVLVER